MITYSCPQCHGTVNSPESEVGKKLDCPHCKASIPVPPGASNKGLIIGLVSLVVVVVGCPLLIVVSLAAVSVMGQKASGTFTSVGQSIGR